MVSSPCLRYGIGNQDPPSCILLFFHEMKLISSISIPIHYQFWILQSCEAIANHVDKHCNIIPHDQFHVLNKKGKIQTHYFMTDLLQFIKHVQYTSTDKNTTDFKSHDVASQLACCAATLRHLWKWGNFNIDYPTALLLLPTCSVSDPAGRFFLKPISYDQWPITAKEYRAWPTIEGIYIPVCPVKILTEDFTSTLAT